MTSDERPATRFEDLDPDPLTVTDPAERWIRGVIAHDRDATWRAGHDMYRELQRRRHPALVVAAGIIAGFLLGFVVASLSSRTEARAVQSEVTAPLRPVSPVERDARLAISSAGLDSGAVLYTARLSGFATWYDVASGHAAAGPALRTGDWRGRVVTVCAGECVTVRLTDWCACSPRHGVPTLIDLARADFARLAPPSQGLVRVTVGPGVAPATDTEVTP